jgi:hypothetical protein
MRKSLRAVVRERARNRCEYCHLPDSAFASVDFHVEHVIAKQHHGPDGPENR